MSNSKERITAALRKEEVDYAPCVPAFWWSGFNWKTEGERLNTVINELGVDAVIRFSILPEHSQKITEKV